MSPSAYIGVTADLKVPTSFQLKSHSKPSLYDYQPNIVKDDKKNDNKADTAKELSITVKAKIRAKFKKDDKMDVEIPMAKKPSLLNPKPEEPEKPKDPEP